MNIAEKVLQLKQDFDEVYEAGKAAGGGSGKNYVEGTVTFADTSNSKLTVVGNFGFVPTLFMLFPNYEIDYTINAENAAVMVRNEVIDNFAFNGSNTGLNTVFETRNTYGTYGSWFTVTNGELNDTTVVLPLRNPSYPYRAGVEYKWIAIE
jgi:hypothetical protein